MAGDKSYHSLVSEETNSGNYAWLKISLDLLAGKGLEYINPQTLNAGKALSYIFLYQGWM